MARAVASPSGLVLAGGGAAVGIVAGLPVLASVALGGLALAGRVAVAVARGATEGRIDPFALNEPWRRFVASSLKSRRKFDEAVRRARGGPLRDRLQEIGGRIDDAVQACWRTAQQGQALADARSQLDTSDAEYQRAQLRQALGGTAPVAGSVEARRLAALDAQLASAGRLEATIADARDRLRLLDARMDESVARALELSVRVGGADELGSLGDDVDAIVEEMEALRQGLEEIDRPAPGLG